MNRLKKLIKKITNGLPSYGVITVGSPESPDMEILYKGKKVINVHAIVLNASGMMFEDKKINWRKKFENQ